MPSPAGKVVFSITWSQLHALRSLPRPIPDRGYPYASDAALIDKGLADLLGGRINVTPEGMALRTALARLVLSEAHE